jgi:hypothetical protein
LLFLGFRDIGGTAVVRDDKVVFCAVMIKEWNLKLVREGVYNGGADAESSERTWPRHKGNLNEIMEGFVVLGEAITENAKKLFGHFSAEIFVIFKRFAGLRIGEDDVGIERGCVEVEFHYFSFFIFAMMAFIG